MYQNKGEKKADLTFLFQDDQLLMVKSGSSLRLPRSRELRQIPSKGRWFAEHGIFNCFVNSLPRGFSIPETAKLLTIRQLFGHVNDEIYSLAGRAVQILNWDLSHRFCGRCAAPLEEKQGEIAKICPSCRSISYPRISPAVIMTVERKDAILLGRSPHFPKGMYSTLAGFVEPGETLEQAVCREVQEEVNVKIAKIRYFGSQPWPFPHSLMVGFTSRYAGGKIIIDEAEIEDAQWFSKDAMPPKLPSSMSIARKLIDDFLARQNGNQTS